MTAPQRKPPTPGPALDILPPDGGTEALARWLVQFCLGVTWEEAGAPHQTRYLAAACEARDTYHAAMKRPKKEA